MTAQDFGQNWSDEPLKENEGRYECDGCGLSVLIWDGETVEDLEDRGISNDCELELVRQVMQS